VAVDAVAVADAVAVIDAVAVVDSVAVGGVAFSGGTVGGVVVVILQLLLHLHMVLELPALCPPPTNLQSTLTMYRAASRKAKGSGFIGVNGNFPCTEQCKGKLPLFVLISFKQVE